MSEVRNRVVYDLARKADADVCRVLMPTLSLLDDDHTGRESVVTRVLITQLAGLTACHVCRGVDSGRWKSVSEIMTQDDLLYVSLFVYALTRLTVFGDLDKPTTGAEQERDARVMFEKLTGRPYAGRAFTTEGMR